jgi:N-acetylneuraminic acid mutarotase
MKVRPILIFSFILILTGCTKEENFEFPIVQTGDVVEITEEGVVFYGKIMNRGDFEIMDHGFVWDTIPQSTIDGDNYRNSLGEYSSELFSSQITSALVEGQTYYVRAYVQEENQIVYGRSVSFKSFGSKAPVITDFNPKTATWGDTLFIVGENFSLKKGENEIEFGKYKSDIVDIEDTLLTVLVPETLDTTNIYINLSYLNFSTKSQEKFNLIPPVIDKFTPINGTYGDTVIISGEYFGVDKTQVYFNDIETKINSINSTQIEVVVPPGLTKEDVEIGMVVASQIVISNQYFISDVPQIAAINPKNGTWNDIITIEGNNFSKDISLNTVRFNETAAEIVEANQTSLKVMVPANLLTETSKISVEVNTQIGTSEEVFTLNQPEIISFDPMLATFRDIITISGQNFNPELKNNKVFFGETQGTVLETSLSELKVAVPDSYFSKNGKNKIKITVGDMQATTNNNFELILHSIDNVTPVEADRNDQITIAGNNFNPSPDLNKVYLDTLELEVISASKNEIITSIPKGVSHGVKTLKVDVAGQQVSASQSVMIYEPWSKVNDFPGEARSYGVSFSINGKGYFGGGEDQYLNELTDFWEYDPVLDIWTQKSDLPVGSTSILSLSTGSYAYIIYEKQFWRYDPSIDSWTSLELFPGVGLSYQTGFVIGENVYIGAGSVNGYSTREFWKYNENSETWTSIDKIPQYVHDGVGFSINNKGYVATGWYRNRNLFEYDQVENTWVIKKDLTQFIDDMNNGRYDAVGFEINGKGYIATGKNIDYLAVYDDIYEYSPEDNSMVKKVSLPGLGRRGASSFIINGKAYIGAGSTKIREEKLIDFWEFDPSKIKR